MIDFVKLNTYGIKKVIYLDSIESTNKFAKNESADDDVLIAAGHQFKGKGRFDRKWESEKYKNITITIIKKLQTEELHLINFYVSYIIYRALNELLAERFSKETELIKLKWPNDVLLDNKKICGILSEVSDINENPKKFIIGIGINVNQEEFPEEISHKATSLKKHFGEDFSSVELINKIIRLFYENLQLISQGKLLMELWRLNTNAIGRKVDFVINSKNEKVSGEVMEIQDDGGIKIKLSDNSNPKNICTYYTGEISFIY